MKRFDVEQFLSLTMVLATAGAVGVGVYSNRGAEPEPEPKPAVALSDEAFPQAEPDEPDPVASPVVAAPPSGALAPMPTLDAAPELLDAAPGPQVEGMDW